MRIKVINPNTDEQMTESIRATAESCCDKDTEIITVHSQIGPQSIENYFDEFLAIPGVLNEIIKGDKEENIDAYVIACFDDPGVPAAREATDKPVIGIAEAAMATMRFIAPSFSIISVLDRSKHMNVKLARELGYSEVLRSVRSTGMSVLDFGKDYVQGLAALERESRKAIEEDGAEGILLGCAGFVDFAKEMQGRLGVPVLEGVTPAVKIAEMLVKLNYKTCKLLSYSYPEEKSIIGYDNVFSNVEAFRRR